MTTKETWQTNQAKEGVGSGAREPAGACSCKFSRPGKISPPTPLLPYPSGCREAVLIRRYKRFLADCRFDDGTEATAHTNNSGSMLGLTRPGSRVFLSKAPGAHRKLPYTLEMVSLNGMWAGVNTLVPNRLLKAAFFAGLLPWAAGYERCETEVKRGQSRMDARFTGPGLPPLWVECKNVSLVEDGVAAFPDAVSERGQKHLREMADIARSGERAAFFYLVQRSDASCFAPADYVDAEYARLFYKTAEAGVAAYPHFALLSTAGISLGPLLPLLPPPAMV